MNRNKFEKHSKKILIGIFVVSMFFAVFGTEILLSLIQEQKQETNAEVRYIRLKEHPPSTIRYVVPSDTHMSETDSLVQKEFKFEIDDDGYIYPSKIHEQSDITVIFLGGSTTECIYVDEKNRFPYLVGRLLEKNGKQVNSFNSGVCGNNSMHSIDILLNKGLALRPDVAVMMHNLNDLTILLYGKNYWNKNPTRSLLVASSMSYHNNIYYHMKGIVRAAIPRVYEMLLIFKNKIIHKDKKEDEFAHLRGKKLTINKQKIIEKFERNLLTFIAICKSNAILPILMTQANRVKKKPDRILINNWRLEKDFGITYEEYKDIYDVMNNSIKKVGRSNMVSVIDLAKEVPQDNAYMYDFVHFNDNGSKYAAMIIAERLNSIFN